MEENEIMRDYFELLFCWVIGTKVADKAINSYDKKKAKKASKKAERKKALQRQKEILGVSTVRDILQIIIKEFKGKDD